MRRVAVIALTTLATAGSLSAQAQAPRELQRSDFTVIDAGQPTQIKDFYVGDSPISLAILLDISGSMAVGGNMDRAREAIGMVAANLRDKQDEAALFTFDSKLQEVIGFTSELDRIRV